MMTQRKKGDDERKRNRRAPACEVQQVKFGRDPLQRPNRTSAARPKQSHLFSRLTSLHYSIIFHVSTSPRNDMFVIVGIASIVVADSVLLNCRAVAINKHTDLCLSHLFLIPILRQPVIPVSVS